MERVVIFGSGYHGRAAYRKLKNNSNCKVLCFIDNGKEKEHSYFDDVEICSPRKIKELLFDKIVITGRYTKEQSSQVINDLGISKSKLWLMSKEDIMPSSHELSAKEELIYYALTKFVEIIKKGGVEYWLDYSSLLAVVRGDLFSVYSDVDIAMTSQEDAKKLWNLLTTTDSFRNYELAKYICKEKTSLFKIGDILKITIISKSVANEEPATIDLHINSRHGNNIYMASDLGYFHHSPDVHFSDFDTILYKELSLRIPIKLNEYLMHIYGHSWKKPVANWSNSGYMNISKGLL